MGFFDEMLAGGLAGAGKGMSELGAMNEREDEKRAQLEAQMQLKRELAAQRSEDLAAQRAMQRDIAEARWGDGSGGGGGSGSGRGGKGASGMNLLQMAMTAKTPEEQNRVVKLATMLDPNAGAAIADQLYGRPLQETISHVPQDGVGPVPEQAQETRGVQYDKQKGALALQRMYTVLMDPSKLENYADGERKIGMNDFGVAAARQTGKETGGDVEEMGKTFGTVSNPNLNTSKDDLTQARLDEAKAKRIAIEEKGAADREARKKYQEREDARKAWQAAQKDGKKEDAAAFKKRYLALGGTEADIGSSDAPVAPSQPVPGAFTYTPRKPSAAAAAFKGQR